MEGPSRGPSLSHVRHAEEVLEEARCRAAAEIEETAGEVATDPGEWLDVLREVVVEVRRILDQEGRPELAELDPRVPAVVALLRRQLLTLTGPPDPVLHVLRALEQLQPPVAPGEHAYRDPGADLRRRLRAPDAFRLLVEVAHDFRSPLTSILFLSETLRDGHSGSVSDHQRSQLGLIYSAAFGLAAIASDVIDLARDEQDLIDPDPQPYALTDVFTDVQRLVQPVVEEKGLELRVQLPERSKAWGYPHALSRVLLNLTTNALKHTESGFVDLGVVRRPHDQLEYFVRDSGKGIGEEAKGDLFQAFKRRRGDAPGEFFSGSGIGLSIARRLVRAMGSDLKFESTEGMGSRFWFSVSAGTRSPEP